MKKTFTFHIPLPVVFLLIMAVLVGIAAMLALIVDVFISGAVLFL